MAVTDAFSLDCLRILFLSLRAILVASRPKSHSGFHPAMNKPLSLLALLTLAFPSWAAPPVVSNVTASQRAGTKLVDIYYTVSDADGDAQNIQVQVSADGGLTYTIPCVTLSGNVGAGVTPGTNRHIVWNAGTDWNGQFVPSTKVRVTANDGTTPPPPPGMVYIPAGTFQMGDNFNEIGTDTLPVHNVYVSGFFMDQTEVSKELWQAVLTWSTGHGYDVSQGAFAGAGHPVYGASWYSVAKWCNARSEKEGLTPVYYTDDSQTAVYRSGTVVIGNTKVKWSANGYRLPTEAEWEKAARGGSLGLRYPWGDSIDGSQANYSDSGDPFDENGRATTPCGYYNGAQTPAGVDMANNYGLYDMAGNVFEWCWDWHAGDFYGDPSANTDPHGPETGSHRIVRGGSYSSASSYLRIALRSATLPTSSSGSSIPTYHGLRCARGL